MGMEGLTGVRRAVCPHCLTAISLADCAIVARDSGLLLWRPSLLRRVLGRVRLPSLDGPRFRDRLPGRQCPNDACRGTLPHNAPYTPLCPIQIVGRTAADRGSYRNLLHVLLTQRAGLSSQGARLLPLEEMQPRRGEDGASVPQLYALLLPDSRRPRPLNLLFIEGAGPVAPSGLIVLIDAPSLSSSAGATAGLLRAVAERSWRGSGGRQGDPIRIPLSIVLSQADGLRIGIGPASTLNREVEELLGRLGGDPIVDAARLFRRRSYHRLDPDAADLSPVVWILYELGAIAPGATRLPTPWGV